MQDLVLQLDTSNPEDIDKARQKQSHSDDLLGSMLHGKWTQWSDEKRLTEENWLSDLRAYNQINDPGVSQISKYHSHIYIGQTRTKCTSAYARVTDLMSNKHWSIEPTPVPESELENEGIPDFIAEMKKRSEAMEKEIEDKLLDLRYMDHLKTAVLEGSILGSGVVKGTIPGTKRIEKWAFSTDEETGEATWDVVKSEIPAPQMSAPSVFNIYPDPYATCVEDLSGLFERHVINRSQFSDLKDDPHFDEAKINEILANSEKGNHVSLYHENERRNIADNQDVSESNAERYDLLEYWGQVTGRMLATAGVDDVEDSGTYWANVWVCAGKTLLARVMPMKKQRIPYNFFFYNKIPHQFWGVGPARMNRASQACLNGSIRSLLDGMAWAASPILEVNVFMLKDQEMPADIGPGHRFARESGDASVPAVRFFQPSVPSSQLMEMAEMFTRFSDDETSIPSYTYGDSKTLATNTSTGMSMQLGAAQIPIKSVIKNLEDGIIKPLITSLFDWLMQWADDDAGIKGDMEIRVLGTSELVAKEVKSNSLLQFANITANPIDMKMVDRRYILEQIAKSMELDVTKAVPAQMPEMPSSDAPQETMLDQARAQLAQVQAAHEKVKMDLTVANTASTNVKTEFSAMQTGGLVLAQPNVVAVGDALMKSAGYLDHDGLPSTEVPQGTPQQLPPTGVPQNTSPQFPANPASPDMKSLPQNNLPQTPLSPEQNVNQGVETIRNEQAGIN